MHEARYDLALELKIFKENNKIARLADSSLSEVAAIDEPEGNSDTKKASDEIGDIANGAFEARG
jgi:hypothetical protein